MKRKLILCLLCFLLVGSALAAETEPDTVPQEETQQERGGMRRTQPPEMQTADGETAEPPEMPGADGESGFQPQKGGMGGFPGDMSGETQTEQSTAGVFDVMQEYQTPIISVLLLGLAFVFVIFYKRKRY